MKPLELVVAVALTALAPAGIRYAYQTALEDASREQPAQVMPVSTPIRGLCGDAIDCLGPAYFGTPAPFKGITAP
jgi:hypothetical protein